MADAAQRLRWTSIDEEAPLPGLGERITYPEFKDIEFVHVRAKSLLNHVPSAAQVPFDWTINVYRGCSHACGYCFARPSHTWLDLDAGRDFESVIVVKINAVERLRAELRSPRWRGEHVALGTNTDPYQRAEGRYRLTRGVIGTLTDAGNSYSVLTKGTLITRDLDVLADAASRGVCTGAALSIPTLDDDVWRGTEPGAPHPARRMETVAALTDAGIPTGVMVAPIIPGLSDGREQLERVIRAAIEAGASHITPITLHLRPGVREIFLPWLEREHPELAERYRRLYRRAYAPEFERKRISRLVHDLIAANGGTRPHPARSHRRFRGGARQPDGPTANGTASAPREDGRGDDPQLSLWPVEQ